MTGERMGTAMRAKKLVILLAVLLVVGLGLFGWFRPREVVLPENCRLRVTIDSFSDDRIFVDDPEKKEMFEKGTHFNPVDLVCAVRDYKGHKFDLVKYVDKATGFISYKSKNGKDLKALELPGLWNGAMSDWNTVFVEVPLTTFNPVKTVNDLLREQHQ